MKIKYVRTTKILPQILPIMKGEWIDLRAAESKTLKEGDFCVLSLGIRMQLPKEFEAWIVPRSSTFKNHHILQTNSFGVIDSSYCGPNDEWKMPVLAMKNTSIDELDRICQFRIMPSQKASIWTKLKWLFTGKVEFIEEEYLTNAISNRGGLGSTGVK